MLSSYYNKKIVLLLFFFLIILTLIGCEMLQEEEKEKRVYLNIDVDNPYSVEKLQPGQGRYIYDKDAVAKIEFEHAEGYEFVEWQGEDGQKVVKKDSNNYNLLMSRDRKVKLGLELLEFKLTKLKFDGLDNIEEDFIEGIPHNLEYVVFQFNNTVHQENEIIVEIENVDDGKIKQVESDNISIEDNKIIIDLVDWRDNFYVDEEKENHLEFAQKYEMRVQNSTNDNIFDINTEEIGKKAININFIVEEPYPETPGDINQDVENGVVKLSWLHSKTNAKIDNEEYVEDYIIYKNVNDDNFEDEDELEIININIKEDLSVDSPQNKKILRYKDEDIDLENNNYYYCIKAKNEYDNESRISEIVGTD